MQDKKRMSGDRHLWRIEHYPMDSLVDLREVSHITRAVVSTSTGTKNVVEIHIGKDTLDGYFTDEEYAQLLERFIAAKRDT